MKPKKLVNLTDDICLQIGEDIEDRHYIYADSIAGYLNEGRAGATAAFMGQAEGADPLIIPCVEYRTGYVIGLPSPKQAPGTRYIVDRLTFELNPEREDLLTGDMATAIYDDNGIVVAFRRFLKHAPQVSFPEPGVIEIGPQQERIGQNPYALHEFADDYDPSS